jgi:hypothetical protein
MRRMPHPTVRPLPIGEQPAQAPAPVNRKSSGTAVVASGVALRPDVEPNGSTEVHRPDIGVGADTADDGIMSAHGENERLDAVAVRLAARFPTLAPEHVHRIVGDERQRLERSTVREVVPNDVEDAAMEQLRKDADPVRIRAEDDASRRVRQRSAAMKNIV